MFRQRATRLQRQMWWKNKKIIGVMVAVVLVNLLSSTRNHTQLHKLSHTVVLLKPRLYCSSTHHLHTICNHVFAHINLNKLTHTLSQVSLPSYSPEGVHFHYFVIRWLFSSRILTSLEQIVLLFILFASCGITLSHC